MAIRVETDEETGETSVIVAPAGEYGYGTIGQATPATAIGQAWREIQRAGITKAVDRDSARLRTWNAGCAVVYTVQNSRLIPARLFR